MEVKRAAQVEVGPRQYACGVSAIKTPSWKPSIEPYIWPFLRLVIPRPELTCRLSFLYYAIVAVTLIQTPDRTRFEDLTASGPQNICDAARMLQKIEGQYAVGLKVT